jgi:hypothetical protein
MVQWCFTTFNCYDNDRELLPAGLLGPVMLTAEDQRRIRE